MRTKLYIISFICFWILIITAQVFLHYRQKPIIKTKVVKQVIYKTKTVNKIDRVKLVDWIYHNSFRCSHTQAQKYAGLILKQAYPLLTASIIKRESSFDSTATNKANGILVIGLTQVYCSPQHIKQLREAGIIKSVRDLYSTSVNVRAGVYILNDIIKINKGNLGKSLKMYCGNSRGYSRRVLETLGQLVLEVK